MDKIPQAGNIFIGGLRALDSPDGLVEAKITHILSVLEFDYCDYEEYKKYERLLVQVEDQPGENLICHFSTTNAFLDSALRAQGVVLVHCAMGVSRSSAVVCAYLMHKQGVSTSQALERVREGRPLCAPNPGFVEQLEIYDQMLKAETHVQSEKIYTDWMRRRSASSKI